MATFTTDVVVAAPESEFSGLGNVWSFGKFRVGASDMAADDIVPANPPNIDGRIATVVTWARSNPSRPEPFGFASLFIRGATFISTDITSIDVMNGEEAVVEGFARRGIFNFTNIFSFRLTVNDEEGWARWEYWRDGFDDPEGPPRFRFTGEYRPIAVNPR